MMLAKCLVLVIAALVLPVHCEDVKLPVGSQDVISISSKTNERHRYNEKDVGIGDNRQGRMALHAEAPSSKAKREQALKNILAARRRQLLGSRISEVQKTLNPLPKTSRPLLAVSKDPLDMLEAQETRHGIYVTAPIGDEVSIIMENDEEDSLDFLSQESLSKTSPRSSSPKIIPKPLENIDESKKNSLLIRINETIPWSLTGVKINETTGSKNISQPLARSQKILENENRRKNTVAMPESLYNHFRPVESNIPVEDMTQFLYFGQKLHPENQNASTKSTNNTVLDVTPTSSSLASTRRRYSKRFSTTTAIPVPRLEDIINEEMNIALERSTIERNKIPKIKNVFRSPGSGTYFRKSPVKMSDPTIVSNVILTRETGRNLSVISDNKRENVLLGNSGKFAGDSSAHANRDQVAIVTDRDVGSKARVESVVVAVSTAVTAHPVGNVTIENAADSIQFRAEMAKRDERRKQRRDNFQSSMNNDESASSNNEKINRDQSVGSKIIEKLIPQSSINLNDTIMEMSSTTRHETIDRITTWQSVHSNHESTTFSAKIDSDNETKMTWSTINDLNGNSKISSQFPTTTTTSLGAHSTLRIVVTEPMGYSTSGIETAVRREKNEQEAAEEEDENEDKKKMDENNYRGEVRDPVNQPDARKNRTRMRFGDSHPSLAGSEISEFPSSTINTLINNSRINLSEFPSYSFDTPIASASIESKLSASVSSIEREKKPTVLPSIVSASAKAVKTEEKHQPHAYAYEITNVTRLLRNYTGPGLNVVVEQQQQQQQQVKEDKRRKENARENERAAEQEKENEEEEEEEKKEEEENKNTSKKKQQKLEDLQSEEREKEGEGERDKEMERGPALTRTSSIQEIRNGGGSVQPTPQQQQHHHQQPLPLLLLPTLQRAAASSSNEGSTDGGIVEPARMPGELSAGTDVGEATTSISADSDRDRVRNTGDGSAAVAVGGRGGGGVGGGGGGGKIIGARNILPSAFTTFATDEVISQATTAGVANNNTATTSLPKQDRKIIHYEVTETAPPLTSTLRWNHTVNNRVIGNVDRAEIIVNDRRYLRKSASAVLGQRTIEEGLVKEVKRRRGSNFFGGPVSSSAFASSLNNRRKSWRNGANEERTSGLRSMENRTAVLESADVTSSTSKLVLDENAHGGVTEKFSEVSEAMTEIVEEVTVGRLGNINQTVATRSIPMEGITVVPSSTLESPVTRSTEEKPRDAAKSDVTSAKVKEVEEKSVERSNLSGQVIPSGANATVVTSERTKDRDLTLIASTSTAASSEKSVEVTTTSAPPIFPVTPRMLPETGKTGEVSEVNPGSLDENKTEASRPFGLAKDLDPSEIQKMYRSQTTLKPESVMTTIIPDLERSTDENPASSTTVKESARTMSPVNSSITRKPLGGERSPEVRGRNLSDKSKDNKDDVLPIMQLYNTSAIFNGTGKDSPDSTSTVKSLDLPGVIEVNETKHDEPDLTRTITTTTMTTTHDPEIGENSTMEKKEDNSSDARTGSVTPRKNNNRHGSSREETNDHSGTKKSSNQTNNGNFYNSSQSNRTRNRPNYYQTSSPEFIGYRPEFNASFFEPGMISVSPRESINISEFITKRHDGDTIATQETVAVVSYILATLVVFPIAVGVGLILRRLIIRNRKVLEESDTSSEISCRKDVLNLENGDFKTSIEKAITKLPRIQHLCHEVEKPPPPPSQESRWEFPRDKLRLQTVLGQGNFGQVWKAEADDLTGHQGTTRLVAVKTVKEGASAREKEDLVRELEIMQQLGNHPNVVTLLGCCTEEEPHYLILEYVMYGKLLAYLRDHRTRQDFYNFSEDSAALTSRDLTVFGYCVARGMEYLASKKIIHRDLAARNVLVDHNKLCKIADFGMSRFANDDGEVIEARHGRNALPIRWMAPESLIYSLFTTKTDVWSFGILMWEIVTLGSTPYPDMAAREVMRNVQNGYRLERPSHCRSELFRVISRCWHADPDRRPEFQTLRRDMAQLLEDSMNGHYVDLESFASECTD